MEDVGRTNMAMMERAMSLFTPFIPGETGDAKRPEAPREDELAALRAEVETLRAALAAANAEKK